MEVDLLGALALIAAGTWGSLAAQDSATSGPDVAAQDSVPTFDQLARRVLTLKVQVEALRGRLDPRGRSDRRDEWRPIAWSDSLEVIRAGLDLLKADVRRLRAAYQSAHHDRGLRFVSELIALVERAGAPFNGMAGARDERSARTAFTHLAAVLDALLQKIAEGEACCRLS